MSRPVVVGVAGGSASGKTSVVEALARSLDPVVVAVLRHDAYYRDLSHLERADRFAVNVDHPDSLETDLLVAHVDELVEGRSVDVPIYDFTTRTRAPGRAGLDPAPVLVVEGILVLADPALRERMDLGVFVHVDEPERLARRIARDERERGQGPELVRALHRTLVQPMHDRFVEPSRRFADVTVVGGGRNRDAIDMLGERVRALMNRATPRP